jgi:segregation and condensation protein B
MLSDETLKALIEGILYVAPEPVSLETIVRPIDGEDRARVKAVLEGLIEEYEKPEHGIRIRQVAGGYKFSSKPEHHETLRSFVKSLRAPIRLSKPALETLAVIAYRQPVTLPEIEEIRGVDCGGVAHTLLEKKLVLTAGRKNVVGRPILYRTSREFLVHFGLRDLSELPSLREFEELARQALAPDLGPAGEPASSPEQPPGHPVAEPRSVPPSGDAKDNTTSTEDA